MKKIISAFLAAAVFIAVLSSFSSCEKNEEKEYFDANFIAMDTAVTVRLARNSGKKDGRKIIYFNDAYLNEIKQNCADIAKEIEASLSRTIDGSIVSYINKETDCVLDIDGDFISLLNESLELSENTGGAFNITLGTLTELWNITGDTHRVPSAEEISDALSHTGNDKITVGASDVKKSDRKLKIDLGAIGKGYALEKITEYLESTDVLYGLVSFGGNVSVFGSKEIKGTKDEESQKYKIGITDPLDTSKVVGYVYIDSGYVSVSGDYERYFEENGIRYHHIFDPETGYPADSGLSSVAVICSDASTADALSTALFVMGYDKALDFYKSEKYDFEAVFTKKDGTTLLTSGLSESGMFEEYVEEPAEPANTD